MKCAKCFTENPIPTEVGNEDGIISKSLWFQVPEGGPVVSGIEVDGSIGFAFVSTDDPDPEPIEGVDIVCGMCFSDMFPLPGE